MPGEALLIRSAGSVAPGKPTPRDRFKMMFIRFRPDRLCIPVLFLIVAISSALPAQTQPNSPQASLTVNGQAGNINLNAGGAINVLLSGSPNTPVFLWTGVQLPAPIFTTAGWLNVGPPFDFILDGATYPFHATDGSGNLSLGGQFPWLMPTPIAIDAQGALVDLTSPAGLTLTSPAYITINGPAVTPQNIFFDPLTGAKGVPLTLPPAGTLPGDLPTLSSAGFPGPTDVFFNGFPVHTVFENPFTCYLCHGQVPEIFSAYQGTMMANAARDPLFNGQYTIAVAGMEHALNTGISHLGGELAADFCIRCHSPNAWLSGRSGFEGDGTPGNHFRPGIFDEAHAPDMEGVTCDVCHRTEGFVANATPTAHVLPGQPDSGQLVITPSRTKRGPYYGTVLTTWPSGSTANGSLLPPASETPFPPVPHNPPLTEGSSVSPFHETEHGANLAESTFCGTCHNVTNPLTGHAVERTYTEWLNSDYGNPASPDFKTCQDCHLPITPNTMACTLPGMDPVYGAFNKVRSFFRKHEYVGGNAWIPQILKQMYPLVDQNWTNGNNYAQLFYPGPASRNPLYDAVSAAADGMMLQAAQIDLTATEPTPQTIQASVRITNLTGHKLPTGYPEGRQMWINVKAEDANGQVFFESGALDASSALIPDPQLKIYQAEHGLNYPSLGLSNQPSFHFILNNMIVKDNRIPPKGHVPVTGPGGTDSYDPTAAPWPTGGLYPPNQHWDDTPYTISVPPGTARPIKVTATVFYQSASHEYVSFLANGGDSVVQTTPHPDAVTVLNLWNAGYPAPAMPVGTVGPMSSADPSSPTPGSTAMVIIP